MWFSYSVFRRVLDPHRTLTRLVLHIRDNFCPDDAKRSEDPDPIEARTRARTTVKPHTQGRQSIKAWQLTARGDPAVI